eukprot:CAMPEP_0172482208 /NCGR_PEP_ID=MMETSP1066-20121228/8458_1 /TAXON_ID=671091 /ORGANISM="Coscinodiscus wailesii, Strain CCMP2513" /LENGTH=73 /DNA_ID=CAMNT_0013245139 /DNA_START=48 /DNA_END=266 /DNA_ORIENTATION=+
MDNKSCSALNEEVSDESGTHVCQDLQSKANKLPYETIEHGDYSGLKDPITEIYRSKHDFGTFWNMHCSDTSPL